MHDAPAAELLLLQGPPHGISLLADRGLLRKLDQGLIKDQRCTPVIPPKFHAIEDIQFSTSKYRKRNFVECRINKLKQFCHITTRYDRKASA